VRLEPRIVDSRSSNCTKCTIQCLQLWRL